MLKINSDGQSLMELVVVIAVMVIVIGALVFATIASLRNAAFSQNQAQATKLAQEAIERVRLGRDRNAAINIAGPNVTSWNGSGGNGALWNYHISGDCETKSPTKQEIEGSCYFNILADGSLQNTGFNSKIMPVNAESIPAQNPVFKRAVIISDDLNDDKNFGNDDYISAKKVTAVVVWTDVSGQHESRLTSIFGNPNR